jgi:hypothetical protein
MRLAFAFVVACAAGCYRPHIGNGAFVCGPNNLCPSGYTCNTGLMLCESKSGNALDLGSSGALFTGALGAPPITGAGTLLVDTHTGEIDVVDSMGAKTTVVTPGSTGWVRMPQAGGPDLSIWSFSSLTIPSTVTVKPNSESGDDVPVFASSSNIELDASVNWRGYGGSGGLANQPGTSRVGGAATIYAGQPGMNDDGGGGGGYANDGQSGAGTGGGVGGVSFGTLDLLPVLVGAGGGGGGGVGGSGGLAGGGVAFVALGTLTLSSMSGTTSIDVSGNDGTAASTLTSGGGGGGGSGGSILLSGAQVNLRNGYVLNAAGGKGGAPGTTGNKGGNGSDGRIWIGGQLSVQTMASTPAPVTSPNQLLSLTVAPGGTPDAFTTPPNDLSMAPVDASVPPTDL